MTLRTRLRDSLLARMTTGAQDYPAGELSRSAIVFSPHFDDETLGCGGLICKLVAAGAPVDAVLDERTPLYMTFAPPSPGDRGAGSGGGS